MAYTIPKKLDSTPDPAVTLARIPRLALRVNEAAKALGVSERTLAEWTKAGEVPHIRRRKVLMYSVGELRRWLAAITTMPEIKAPSSNDRGEP